MSPRTIDLIDLRVVPAAPFGETGPVEVVPGEGLERNYGPGSSGRVDRVLVVDDDRQIRNMLEMSLRLEGIDVMGVADGAAALAAVETNRFDLILLDIMMPVLDGYAVMKHLRENGQMADIPVIILSAKAGDEDLWEGWSCGADSYITKPLDLDVLFAEMSRVTSERCAA